MRRIIAIIFLIMAPTSLVGQSKFVKFSVYFDSDKHALRNDAKKSIDNVLDSLIAVNIYKVVLTGNTDNTADSSYNLNLSNKRTEQVKTYLTEKGITPSIIKTSYYGENRPITSNNSEAGKQRNRRVDVIIYYKKRKEPLETRPDGNADTLTNKPITADTCRKDTVIVLPQGTQVVFNLCEYLEIKDCLDFTEAKTAEAILANGMSLMDTAGVPIVSCGMLMISMKPGCTERECFRIPVKVRFPVPQNRECDFCGRNASVWDLSRNGAWVRIQGRRSYVKIIKVQGELFYQMEIHCPNYWKNCDCPPPKGKRLKFKTNKDYKIARVILSSNCPTTAIVFKPKRRKNIAKKKISCFIGNRNVIATIIDANGDTLTLEPMLLNDLTKRTIFSGCRRIKGENIGYRHGILPIRKRNFYRKYLIKPGDLKPKQESQ